MLNFSDSEEDQNDGRKVLAMEKKDQFDFNAESRYVSLDSVVLEARRLARLDDDRYRGRLGWDEIVWTELESQHRDDSYRVVLQFRTPTRDLEQAQTGEEEFIFDLLGTLLDRQVLVWPVSQSEAQPGEPIPAEPGTQSGETPLGPEEPMPAPEEASEQPEAESDAAPTSADTIEPDQPANDSVLAENLSDLTHARHTGTSASVSMPTRPQSDADRSAPETPVGPAIWVTLAVGILLILFDIRNIWDPAFFPGPDVYTLYSIFPNALRDGWASIFDLTFYGTMFAPIGGALAGFSVYRWRTRSRRAASLLARQRNTISSLLYALAGAALGIGVIQLVLQIYPPELWY
ncbi:MAG: hypothetical protein CMJ45_01295 [Planctomyces sp.]|nr:hypothetical protein [Planctomyces sp.]